MITLLFILLKFSFAIMAIWVFYKFLLEKLTFFVSNRFFFLCGISIAFFIAVGRSELIEKLFKNQFTNADLDQYVPSMQVVGQQFFNPITQLLPLANILLTIYGIGVIFLGVNFVIQYLSYLKLKRGAQLREMHGHQVYVVNQDILPFSFGKSIFISAGASGNPEIEKILLHESIHIQQNHSIDLLLAELVRILNWVNPFAWLLKKSIRDNLEFLTDAGTINKGIDKKNYQYLLLHFSGNNPFSLVTNFNFYSLKTRISKMNQNKSNRLQYARFLLFIPMVLVLLFVFSCMNEQTTDVEPKNKKMDELTLTKLKLSLTEPVIELDAKNQDQFKKMDELTFAKLRLDLKESRIEQDAQNQNLYHVVEEKGIVEVKSKLREKAQKLYVPTLDQPKQTLLLQKIEKSSQEPVERRSPPPPPAIPEKQ